MESNGISRNNVSFNFGQLDGGNGTTATLGCLGPSFVNGVTKAWGPSWATSIDGRLSSL